MDRSESMMITQVPAGPNDTARFQYVLEARGEITVPDVGYVTQVPLSVMKSWVRCELDAQLTAAFETAWRRYEAGLRREKAMAGNL